MRTWQERRSAFGHPLSQWSALEAREEHMALTQEMVEPVFNRIAESAGVHNIFEVDACNEAHLSALQHEVSSGSFDALIQADDMEAWVELIITLNDQEQTPTSTRLAAPIVASTIAWQAERVWATPRDPRAA